jgi:hypothetical protein
MEVMVGSRGLFGLALMGFLFKLNVLEIIRKGAWERLSTRMLGSFKQVFYSGRFIGRIEEDAVDIACPFLCHLHT